MEMAKVTSKGQITIPVSIRKRLQINEGDKLLFIDRPDGVMMVNPDLLGSSQDVEYAPENQSTIESTKKTVKSTVEKKSGSSVAKPPKEVEADIPDAPPQRPVSPGIDIKSQTAASMQREKPVAKVGDLNLDSLLDEIRSIGRKI